MKASDILAKAVIVLKDPDYVRWPEDELLGWLSEAQVATARVPGAYSIHKVIDLKEGTRQSLPEDAWALVTILRNVDEDGETPITPVRVVTRALLDSCIPRWHMGPRKMLAENYVYDEREPRIFYVYPPNNGYGKVEAVYQGIPPALTSVDDEIVLDDSYAPALLSYVLYRAFSKESDYSPGIGNASSYFSAYNNELSAALQARGMTTPNDALDAGSPRNSNGGTE